LPTKKATIKSQNGGKREKTREKKKVTCWKGKRTFYGNYMPAKEIADPKSRGIN